MWQRQLLRTSGTDLACNPDSRASTRLGAAASRADNCGDSAAPTPIASDRRPATADWRSSLAEALASDAR